MLCPQVEGRGRGKVPRYGSSREMQDHVPRPRDRCSGGSSDPGFFTRQGVVAPTACRSRQSAGIPSKATLDRITPALLDRCATALLPE